MMATTKDRRPPRGRTEVTRAEFAKRHGRTDSVFARIQREVIGADVGVAGYTTIDQANALTRALELRPGMRLLDVGAGQGWPGLHLAQTSVCEVVLTDVPASAIRSARRRAKGRRILPRCAFIMASGAALPFKRRSFDAVVHTDVL